MGVRIGNVGIDTNDLARASAFWQAMTGYEPGSADESSAVLADPTKGGPDLFLQVVPEPRVGKNRLHLDLFTADLPGEVARAQGLGATEVQRFVEGDGGWIVLADPDGNQFCIVAE
ncbi:MAG: VOC family protein [Acidimicrobiia bacterium]|nr:VOC family protein [Acidimicrobiia bacterium]